MMRHLITTSLILMTACTVGPRYESPEMSLAPDFTETDDTCGTLVDLKTWWTQFEDPVLNAMIEEAIVKNYDLQIAGERIAEVRARYDFASANLWPEVDLNASAIRSRTSQTLFDSPFLGPPIQNLFQIGFDASWELDFWGRLRSLKSAALFELEASQENFRNVYITLLAEMSRNYSTFRSLQKKIIVILEQIQVNEGLLAMAKVRFNAGLKAEIEPLQVQAELENLQSSLPPLEARKNETLYHIAVLLGRSPEDIPEEWYAYRKIPEAAGKIPLGLPSTLLQRRPDIRRAERDLAAVSSRVNAAIAKLFPTFSLSGSFGYQSDQMNNLFTFNSSSWSVGPGLFWPAIDFGRIRSEIDFTKAAQRESLLNYENIVLKALEDVESSLANFTKEERKLQTLRLRLTHLKSSRNLNKALFEAGLASLSDLLNADNQVLFAEQDVVSSEELLSGYLIAVYKSLGGEWPCSLTP